MRKVASAIGPDAESQGSDLEVYRAPARVSPVNKDIVIWFHYHLRYRDNSTDIPPHTAYTPFQKAANIEGLRGAASGKAKPYESHL